MANIDPFEAFKNRREIELLECRFKKEAKEQRQRVDDALAEDDVEAVVEDKVTREMQDFFKESTDNVEKVLVKISGPVEPNDIEEALEQVATTSPDPAGVEGDAPPDVPAAGPSTKEPLDLRAALARIRQHKVGQGVAADEVREETAASPVATSPGEEAKAPVAPGVEPGLDFGFGSAHEPQGGLAFIDPLASPESRADRWMPVAGQDPAEPELTLQEPGALMETAAPEPEPELEFERPAEAPRPAAVMIETAAETEAPGPAEPSTALPVASDAQPTFAELTEEVRRLKLAFAALVRKGILAPEEYKG